MTSLNSSTSSVLSPTYNPAICQESGLQQSSPLAQNPVQTEPRAVVYRSPAQLLLLKQLPPPAWCPYPFTCTASGTWCLQLLNFSSLLWNKTGFFFSIFPTADLVFPFCSLLQSPLTHLLSRVEKVRGCSLSSSLHLCGFYGFKRKKEVYCGVYCCFRMEQI